MANSSAKPCHEGAGPDCRCEGKIPPPDQRPGWTWVEDEGEMCWVHVTVNGNITTRWRAVEWSHETRMRLTQLLFGPAQRHQQADERQAKSKVTSEIVIVDGDGNEEPYAPGKL
ncbi:hypothetical protein I5Q34_00360 [Streptomyces sp. AV19]|uniref:hypothetical protein n=1 Tax=Streptomyces sp. AV19 TaxID=2793068 RepID=UPI0018FEBE2E|nr:hypothetical protein [Streptomyces sp. AV19]MBH1932760.1 hypothetical protein [Streptomyces sp. AV19]MDG4531431.1 hypothetical protein [Streptomyces sp. AV19]